MRSDLEKKEMKELDFEHWCINKGQLEF
jgi:hypothetical protein